LVQFVFFIPFVVGSGTVIGRRLLLSLAAYSI
jgi:hypothetical protein